MGTTNRTSNTAIMKSAIVLLLAAMAYAAPASLEVDSVELLHSEVVSADDDGAHSMRFAADNGIDFELSGQEGEDGGTNMQGSYTYIVDGESVPLAFVANENGYQPESSLLPVAPAFPHPIPQFVLDQIAFAAEQRAAGAYDSDEK